MILNILKLDGAVKRKMDLGLVEYVEDDDFIAAMPQVMHPLQNRARIGQQIAEQDDQALRADHRRQMMQALRDVGGSARFQCS